MKTKLVTTILTLVILVLPGIANAQIYPQYINIYVNDFAGIISQSDSDKLEASLSDLRMETGVEFTVVTIDSRAYYKAEGLTIEQYANNLFNVWRIGDKDKNNGVLMLVSIKDREARIQLGAGYSKHYNSAAQSVINESILPYFKEGRYSVGIVSGTEDMIGWLSIGTPWYITYAGLIILILLIVLLISVGISLMKSGKKGWGWAFLAGAGVLLFFILRSFFRGLTKGGGSGFGGGHSAGGGASGRW